MPKRQKENEWYNLSSVFWPDAVHFTQSLSLFEFFELKEILSEVWYSEKPDYKFQMP